MKWQLVLAHVLGALGWLSALCSDVVPGARFHQHWVSDAIAAAMLLGFAAFYALARDL